MSLSETYYPRLQAEVESLVIRRLNEACLWIKDMRRCDFKFRNPTALLRSQQDNCKQCLNEAKMLIEMLQRVYADIESYQGHPALSVAKRAEDMYIEIKQIALTVYCAQSTYLSEGIFSRKIRDQETENAPNTIGDLFVIEHMRQVLEEFKNSSISEDKIDWCRNIVARLKLSTLYPNDEKQMALLGAKIDEYDEMMNPKVKDEHL